MELMAQRRSDGVALIEEHGGMKSLADHLKTDLKTGISCNPGEHGLISLMALFTGVYAWAKLSLTGSHVLSMPW